MTDSSTNTFYNVDRPIENISEDSLHRSEFAENLAKAISSWDGSESLVIALYGEWGSGKTSIKNMVVESINSQDNKTVVPIEFNPWYWSGQKELMEAFFREIGTGFEKQDTVLSEKLRTYSKVLRFGSSVVKFIDILPSGIPFLKVATSGLEAISETLDKGAELSDNQESNKSLNDIKNEIKTTLEKSETKYLIIIDDIDRLPSDQIRMMFQLIKANADFPKFVYLLMFQKDIVEKALEIPGENINGQSYLNKIIQIPFNVPMANTTIIHKYLENNIRNIFEKHGISSELTPEVLGESMRLIGPLFNNYRDVKRFLNTLSINMVLFINDQRLMVNPVDYILIETIRVFNSELYDLIFKKKLDQSYDIPTGQEIRQKAKGSYAGFIYYLFGNQALPIASEFKRKDATDPRLIRHSKNVYLYYSLFIKE